MGVGRRDQHAMRRDTRFLGGDGFDFVKHFGACAEGVDDGDGDAGSPVIEHDGAGVERVMGTFGHVR